MYDASCANQNQEPEIASHLVSEDGVNWRPFDPARDTNPLLHTRIEFAPPESE